MSPASESLVKKLVVFASLVVFGSSIAFLVVACGTSQSSSLPPREGGSSSPGWRALPAAPIEVDADMTSVWTGKEMIVSGVGGISPDGTSLNAHNVAAAYDPTAGTWRQLAPPLGDGIDPGRRSAVWTGTEMLVWGAFKTIGFNPSTNRWRLLPYAPGGGGLVVWTGQEMIGWGGGCCGDANSDGAAYSPATGKWRTLARSPLAPAQRPIGAWTGRELVLLVSGIDPGSGKPWPARFARAAAYDPATDTWRRIAPPPESGPRLGGTAVWDGREIIVVGAGERSQDTLAYDSATNHWRRLASMERGHAGASSVWTGKRLLVWGGTRYATTRDDVPAQHGLSYDPETDRWSALPEWPLRSRDGSAVTWTGRQLVVWGGVIGTPLGKSTPPDYLTNGAAFTPALERSSR
jgi:hypothetical protein